MDRCLWVQVAWPTAIASSQIRRTFSIAMSAGLRGTTTAGDGRFADKESRMMKRSKFPKEFAQPVDVSRVQLDRMERWVHQRLEQLMGEEDEVLTAYVRTLLEQEELDPKKMQIQLSGFLEDKAATFMKEMWKLLLSAQENEEGIPQQWLDEDAERRRKEREEAEKLIAAMRQKQEDDRRIREEREAERSRVHRREINRREERTRGRGREDRDRRRRSPPPRRRSHLDRSRSRSPRHGRSGWKRDASRSPVRQKGERGSPSYDPYDHA